MRDRPRVWIIGDQAAGRDRLRRALAGAPTAPFELLERGPPSGLAPVAFGPDDVVLLAVPTAPPLWPLSAVTGGPVVVVVVPEGEEGERASEEALALGASDSLTWGELTPEALFRCARRARARARGVALGGPSADSLPLMLWACDASGAIAACNRRARAYLGLGPDGAGGQALWDFAHPDDALSARCRWAEAVNAGSDYRDEFRLRRARDGEHRYHEFRAGPRPGSSGRPFWYVGTAVETDDRRRGEESLRMAGEFFRVASELTSDYAYSLTVGADGAVAGECVTEGFTRITGYASEEARGRDDWDRMIHPEDLPIARKRLETLRAGRPDVSEFRVVSRSGPVRWVKNYARPVADETGRVVRVIGAARDVTDQRRDEDLLHAREQEFRALAENSPDVITRFDRSFRHLYVNPAVETATGRPPSHFIGKSNRELGLDAERCDDWESKIREAFETGREVTVEFEFEGPSGPRFYHSRLVPEFGVDGQARTVLGIATDVTQRRGLQEALERARRGAEDSSRAKSDFLANMSHEIRTPMTAVLGYADLLLRRVTDPDDRECVETIRRNGQHLLELINDILDLSKIEAGQLQVEKRRFPPERIVADVHALMNVRAAEKGLPLRVKYHGLIPATIESDPTRLRQVLVNLVGNAIKFTESGGVRVEVRFVDDRERPHLRFDVIDSGIGMAPDEVARMFVPFAQADSTTTRRFGGTGLGLAICRRLAELLGGSISAETEPGRGSRFWFTADVGPREGLKLVEPRPASGPTPDDGPVASPPRLECRVLVVDDHREVRSLARQYLEDAGATVETAEDGEDAVGRLLRRGPSGSPVDVVVMDMKMPALDGYQAAKALRDAGYDRPIIALTASAMRGDRERCLEAGCDEYLTKPVAAQDLVEAVARAAGPGQDGPAGKSPARRVLVVDDSPDLRAYTARRLRSAGHEPRVAGDGRSALQAAREFLPHVVLLDLGLPDTTGHELIGRLRALEGLDSATFIAVTGRDSPADRERSRAAGFHHHVVKPFAIEALVRLFTVKDEVKGG